MYFYYAMIKLRYSPSALKEYYEAPRHFKALLDGNISYEIERLEKEANEAKKPKK